MSQDEVNRLVFTAFDLGISFFDTADVYGNGRVEKMLGLALSHLPREQVRIATKTGIIKDNSLRAHAGYALLSANQLQRGLQDSLRRLNVDYVDLFQLHGFDPFTPLEEIVSTVHTLRCDGQLIEWGVCNLDLTQTRDIFTICRDPGLTAPCSGQWMCNVIAGNRGSVIAADHLTKSLGLIGFSPLAEGMLTDQRQDGQKSLNRSSNRRFEKLWATTGAEALKVNLIAIGQNYNLTLSELSLAWALQQPGISTVLMGASSPAQIKTNVSVRDVPLSLQAVEEVNRVRRQIKIEFWDETL